MVLGKSQQDRRSAQRRVCDRARKRLGDLTILQLDNGSVVLAQVLFLRNDDLRAEDAAQQAFIMVWSIDRDVARVMKARLALVAVD